MHLSFSAASKAATLALFCCAAVSAKADVMIRTTIPLSKTERDVLAERVRTNAEAAVVVKAIVADAETRLSQLPRPLAVIHYEGLLDTDPRRVETQKSLEDMDRLASLSDAWCATGDTRYIAPLRALILAWSGTYMPTGNAINENKLQR
jgi:hypothetical protein